MFAAPDTYPYSAIVAFGKVLIPAQNPPYSAKVLQVLQVLIALHSKF